MTRKCNAVFLKDHANARSGPAGRFSLAIEAARQRACSAFSRSSRWPSLSRSRSSVASATSSSVSLISPSQNRDVELRARHRHVGEHRKPLGVDLREAAVDHDLQRIPAAIDGENSGPQRGDERRMAGEHAEVAFRARHVDLIDGLGHQQAFRRNEIELEGGHGSKPFWCHSGRAKREPKSSNNPERNNSA